MSSFFSKMEERNRINPEVSEMNPFVKSESFERNLEVNPASKNKEYISQTSEENVWVNASSNKEVESKSSSSNGNVLIDPPSNNGESNSSSSNEYVRIDPPSNNEEESELFSSNGNVRVNPTSSNEGECELFSSNGNVRVNLASNHEEESELLSSSGNVRVNIASKSEEDSFATYSEPLLMKASIKPETNSNHVEPFVLDRQIKVENLEAEEAVESGGTEIGDPDFTSELDSVQFSNISIKLEELPEASEASFPITPIAEIDIKDEFNFLSPVLESVKTEEPPVKSPDFKKQAFFKPPVPDASGQGPDCNPYGLKPCYINVRRIDDKVALKYPCERCKEAFSRKDNLARHKRYHCRGPLQRLKASPPSTPDPNAPSTSTICSNFTCRSCNALFYDKQNLKKHISYHCGGPLQRLGLNNPTSHGYFDRNIPTSSPRPQCEECGKYFSHPSCVKRHFARYHLKPRPKAEACVVKPFSCNHCQRTFKHRHRLLFHLSYHANSTKTCKICGETFGDSYAYNRHMRWGHRPPPEAPPECPTCGKVFGRKWDLKTHVKRGACRKSKKRPAETVEYVCEHCGYAYRWKHSLLKHLQGRGKSCFPPSANGRKKPAGKVKYTCEHCAYSCFRKGSLVRHLSLRTQEPERVCQVCCERVGGPEQMREHLVLVHKIGESVDEQKGGSATELGGFVCEPCGLTFEEKDSFKRHVLQSHKSS